ncbi:phosphatase PAP2 family protein [Streptomyces boninensis]|uniref:phosphatase PAP2 family protein n=1 Tax=Streptomyces boninensis TaxID=2039455 RepID=UPI003B2230B5
MLAAVAGVAVLAFAVMAWQVAKGGRLAQLDERVSGVLVRHQPLRLSEALADLGTVVVAVPVLAAAIGYALARRTWRGPLAAAVAMAAVPLCVVPLKAIFARPGPMGEPLAGYSGYFPSGHAATAAVAYGAAALVLLPLLRTRDSRRLLGAAAAAIVAGNGLGLVWRGYHWPLDVLASWCLAVVLLCAVACVSPRVGPRVGPSSRRTTSRTNSRLSSRPRGR